MSATADTVTTDTPARRTPGWSVEGFAAFWAAPDPSLVPALLTDDIVGHWPGEAEPVRGKAAYTERIAAILRAVPDFRVSVAEHAEAGDLTFIRWVATGTGPAGPFEETGIDRVRVADGLVAENYVCPADSARFAAAVFGAPRP
jgi:predicted SnoaL-like aldol condensation-catalyzing enzyme